MFLKQFLSVALLIITCLTTSAQQLRMFYGETYAFTVISEEDKTAEISYMYSDYSGPMDIVLPESAADEYGDVFTITRVGMGFSNTNPLTSVVIPNTVKEICPAAFWSPTLMLKSVTLGESVEIIGDNAFYGCSSLASINFPESLTTIGDNAFYGCSSLASINFPESLTTIGDYAFSGCSSLASINFSESLTTIGDYAFSGCSSLTSINLPESLISLGKEVFDNCGSLENINVAEGNPNYASSDGVLYNSGMTNLIFCPKAKKSVSIPNTATKISARAFEYCKLLSSIKIPDSVTTIGIAAFGGCESLSSVVIGNGVEELNNTFADCTSLKTVEFGRSVKRIGTQAFQNCGFESLVLPNSLIEIGDAFHYCKSLRSVTFGNSLTYINFSFYGCESLESVDLPASLTYIYQEAFNGCSSLTEINVDEGNSVYSSVDGILYSKDKTELVICPRGLRELNVPEHVNKIGDMAASFSSLEKVTVSNSVKDIASCAFYGCSVLESVTLGNSVKSLGIRSFCGCTSLTNIHLPASLTDIVPSAFEGCTNLTITVEDGNPNYSSDGVGLYSADGSTLVSAPGATGEYTLPPTVTTIAANALSGNSSLSSVVIPNSVTTIEDGAFSYCSALESVTIGNAVPLQGTNGMRTVSAGSALTSIGADAFSGCRALLSVNCMTATPPECDATAWPNEAFQNAVLYVPQGCRNAYLSADVWRNFAVIVDDGTTDIEETVSDGGSVSIELTVDGFIINGADENTVVEVYTLDGRMSYRGVGSSISGLAKGMYIVKVGGRSFKIAL